MKRALFAAGLCLAALSLTSAAHAQKRGGDKSGTSSASGDAAEIVMSVVKRTRSRRVT